MSDLQGIENQVRHILDSIIETEDIRVIDLVGMLENIKFDLLMQCQDKQ